MYVEKVHDKHCKLQLKNCDFFSLIRERSAKNRKICCPSSLSSFCLIYRIDLQIGFYMHPYM